MHLLARKDSFGVHVAPVDSDDDISMSSEDEFDLEGQLEAYIKQGQEGNQAMGNESQMSAGESIRHRSSAMTRNALPLPNVSLFAEHNKFDPIFKVQKKKAPKKKEETIEETESQVDSASDLLKESSVSLTDELTDFDARASALERRRSSIMG